MVDETLILQQLLASTTDIVFVKDPTGRYLACSATHARYMGVPENEMIGKHDSELIDVAETLRYITESDQSVIESGEPYHVVGQPLRIEGEPRFYDIVKVPIRDGDDEVVGLIGIGRDITRRHEVEAQLLHQNRYLEAFNHLVLNTVKSPHAVDGITDLIDRAFDLVGAAWVLLRTPAGVAQCGEPTALGQRLVTAAAQGGQACSVVLGGSREGSPVIYGEALPDASVVTLPIRTGEAASGAIGFGLEDECFGEAGLQRVSEVAAHLSLTFSQRQFMLDIAHRAGHDGLTGLMNRAVFDSTLEQVVAEAARYNREFGVAFLDLDGFKPINDRLGHAAGDKVLVNIANRLLTRLRKSDTVARVGGDEFAIIIRELSDYHDLSRVTNELIEICAEPMRLNGRRVSVAASIGTASFPQDGTDAEMLLAVADRRMYALKQRNQHAQHRLGVTQG